MNRRRLTNTEPRSYPVDQAVPLVTYEQAAWCRISLARVPPSSEAMHEVFRALGIAVAA